MAGADVVQSSFLGGEWSPDAQGRIDLPQYRTAMNVCLNGLPIETGAWARRGGTMAAGPTRDGNPARVIKFDFTQNFPYALEFTDGNIRPYAGSRVASGGSRAIASISSATPAEVTTQDDLDSFWNNGGNVFFTDLGTDCKPLQGRVFTITVTGTDKFTLALPDGTPVNGSTLGSFSAGQVNVIFDIDSPYSNGTWRDLRFVQADLNGEATGILLHPLIATQAITVLIKPTDTVDALFRVDPVRFVDGPYLDPVPNGATATPSGLNGIITLTITFTNYDGGRAYDLGDFVLSGGTNYQSLVEANLGNTPASSPSQWQTVSPGVAVGPDGFQGTDVGRLVRLFSEPALWVVGVGYVAGNIVSYVDSQGGTAYYTCLTNHTAALTNAPGVSLTTWAINAAGARWTWGRITGLGSLIGGGSAFGDMTGDGGLAAAFNGITTKTHDQCATKTTTQVGTGTITSYVGVNHTGSPPQIQSATLYPSSDFGLLKGLLLGFGTAVVTVNLRAKSSSPANSGDGTILGSQSFSTGPTIINAININSNDQVTNWNFVWFEIIIAITDPAGNTRVITTCCAQAQFFSPTGSSTATVDLQIVGQPLLYTTPIRVWRLGLFSDTTGWPKCGTYHEGRLWLSGAVNNRFDATVSGGVTKDVNGVKLDFTPTEQDGTVTDANGISYTFNAKDSNPIFWMEPDLQGIICGTKGGEWLIQATTINSPLTPTNIQAHRVTKIGCADIEPRRTDHTLVFAQLYRRKIMEYFADVFSGKFTAPNLTQYAKHLTKNNVAELAYQQELVPTIWFRDDVGGLFGASYKRDTLMTSQGPTFVGWHRVVFSDDREIESIAVGAGGEGGTIDTLVMVANDPSTDLRKVLFGMPVPIAAAIDTAMMMDEIISPTSQEDITDAGIVYLQMYGLWLHEGKTVSVMVAGLDVGDYTVSSGQIRVPYVTANALFTQDYLTNYAADNDTINAFVGFSFTSQGQIVRPATQAETRAPNGPALGKKRRAHKYAVLFDTAQGVSVSTDFAKMHPCLFSTFPDGGQRLSALTLKSGLHATTIRDDNGYDSMFCWQITRPFPCTVAAITLFLDTRDE